MISQSEQASLYARDEVELREYLSLLLEGIAREVDEGGLDLADTRTIGRTIELLRATSSRPLVGAWQSILAQYRDLVACCGGAFARRAEVARGYRGMEEFWSDARAQESGESRFTFWDTYEHGRRRQLERELAATYGAEDALLLNSGMSALAVALGAGLARRPARLVTGSRGYFETTECLERWFTDANVEIVRVAADDRDAVIACLERVQPDVALFETVTNSWTAEVCSGVEDWFRVAKNTTFVVDNSLQSMLTRWFGLDWVDPNRLLVVESATKYLSHQCVAGVVYGVRATLAPVRNYARGTGQQLQERAFSYFRPTQAALAERALARHSRHAQLFAELLRDQAGDEWEIRSLHDQVRSHADARKLLADGAGSVVFARHRGPDACAEHRKVLEAWLRRCESEGHALRVRAGFGWFETTARAYESSQLNQPDAPVYLRFSVGIEPMELLTRRADWLVETMRVPAAAPIEVASVEQATACSAGSSRRVPEVPRQFRRARHDFGVSEAVERLTRLAETHRALIHVLSAHLIGVPEFEAKLEIAHHLCFHGEALASLSRRLIDLRVSAASLAEPDPEIGLLERELLLAPSTACLIEAAYVVVTRDLRRCYDSYLARTDELTDMPSVRALRRLSAELDSIDDWGDRAASAYRLASNDDEQFLWAEHVRRVLSGIGGIDGRGEREPLPALLQSSRTFEISRRPARDERFSTFSTTRRYASHEQAPWNGNLPPELVEQIRIQRDEIDAIETFANVLHAYSHDSFELVADLSRLVSDEARHAELGHRALEDLGIDPFSVPCSTIGIVVRAQLPPLLAFAQINTFGEINNVGNLRRCARTALGLGQRPLASMFDFIHADELMHIRRGRAWLRQLAGKAGIGELDARARELACARLVAEGIVGEDYALQITDHELSELVGE